MVLDKFGHSKQTVVVHPTSGINFTDDGHLNVGSKRLVNVAEPTNDSDGVTLGYIKKNFKNKSFTKFEDDLKKHIDEMPFEVNKDGDIVVKNKSITSAQGKNQIEKRKLKNVGYPTDVDDSTHKKFVLDSINKKILDLPFTITTNGDIRIKEFKYKKPDGTKGSRKRKILNFIT